MKKLLIVLSAVLAILYGLWQLSAARNFQLFGELVHRVDTTEKVIALTFDDGPSPQYTDAVLAVLAAYHVKATFFVTGAEAGRHLTQTQKLVTAGHQLGNHSFSHPRMLLLSPNRIADEITQTDAAIRQAGYLDDIVFRPPYGKKLFLLPWYLEKHHRLTVMWDLEPESDAKLAKDARAMALHVIDNAKPGSIILLHVMYRSRETSRAALPLIIEGLQQQDYRFVTVHELLAKKVTD